MARVIGIDPGTLSIDVCGLDDGRLFLDRSFPTADALSDPSPLVGLLEAAAPIDLIVGPSGYGLPLRAARDLSEADLLLAYLARAGESGGIGGLRSLVRAMTRAGLPVVVTPGVIHLETVPRHRKINRVDMGTADKVCAAALAIHERAAKRGRREDDVSFVLLELGGGFTSALAVQRGSIVDGIGGTSGPIGARAAGALDGEVAYLAGAVSKQMLFEGGAASVAGRRDAPPVMNTLLTFAPAAVTASRASSPMRRRSCSMRTWSTRVRRPRATKPRPDSASCARTKPARPSMTSAGSWNCTTATSCCCANSASAWAAPSSCRSLQTMMIDRLVSVGRSSCSRRVICVDSS